MPSSVSPEGPERKWGSLWWCRTSRSNHWSRSKARGEHLYVSAYITDAPSIVRTVRLPGVQALTPRSPREAGSSASGASGNQQSGAKASGIVIGGSVPVGGSDCPAVSADGLRVVTGAGFLDLRSTGAAGPFTMRWMRSG